MEDLSKPTIPKDFDEANGQLDRNLAKVKNLLHIFESAAQWRHMKPVEIDPIWWPEVIEMIQEAALPLAGLARTWQAAAVAAVNAEDQQKVVDCYETLARTVSNFLDSLPFFEEASMWEEEQNDTGTDWPAGFRILLSMLETIEQSSGAAWNLTVEHIKSGADTKRIRAATQSSGVKIEE